MNIPDHLFWDSDLIFLDRLILNKTAYDGWYAYVMKKESERKHGK